MAYRLFGCVTTGEAWQFLQLQGLNLLIARTRLYINELPQILEVFQAIVAHFLTSVTLPEHPVPT